MLFLATDRSSIAMAASRSPFRTGQRFGLKTESADHQGVGLENVRDRLAYIYRDQAMLRLSALEPTERVSRATLPNFSEARA